MLGILARTAALGARQELVSEGEFYGRRFANAVACPPLRARDVRFTGSAAEYAQILSSTITFATNSERERRSVQRLRLRSTSEPPPNGPAPVPTPKAPGQPGVLARVQQDEHDQDDREDHLESAEDRLHGREG